MNEEEATYIRNLTAEMAHKEKAEREEQSFGVVIEDEDFIISFMDYSKGSMSTEELRKRYGGN